MERIDSPIQAYLQGHTEAESPLLAQIREETYAHIPMPQMLSGHLQGRVLATFSHMIRPTCILEVGTYTGYSTLCLAEGLQADGVLHTIDKNADLEATVRRYFEQAGKADQIQYHLGQAATIIPQLEATFDLVFIDADKKNYLLYYNLIIDRVSPGGFVVADNVLWSGKVAATADQPVDARTQAIIDFNAYVHADPRVANVLLPIRDGLMVLRKI
ncbi:MAG: O-methyltransferase [Roseivirga sp.]